MAQRPRFSPRDEVYLASTSFEVYMVTGAVFLVIFTAAFITSIKIHFEWMIFPGSFVAVVAAYVTLKLLERREHARKLAEIERSPLPAEDATHQ
jgi:peptidoglycan/LPS O-acetylase OafA/YrhL